MKSNFRREDAMIASGVKTGLSLPVTKVTCTCNTDIFESGARNKVDTSQVLSFYHSINYMLMVAFSGMALVLA